MPNIPRSPNVQHGGVNPSTSCDTTNLANQIIDNKEEEEEERVENLDGQVVDDSICTNNTTPTPDTLIPDSNSNTILVEDLRQLATVTTKLTAASSPAPPKPHPAFRTPEKKRPENFDGSSPAKLLKPLEWVQPYLEVVDDPPPDYMMDSWLMFESQLVTLYGDPNELCTTEYKLDSLTMKDGNHASNYISSFRALQSRLPGWGNRPLMFQFRKGLPTRVLDLLAQNPEVFDTLWELIEATLKINTCHIKRQKEKKQENSSQPSQHKKDTSKPATHPTPSTSKFTSKPASKTPSEITKVLEGGRLFGEEKERRAKAGLCAYCGGKHEVDDCVKKASKNLGKA
ncbi:hypothetical protein H4Q26_004081 [Puccinia striiformis f. sp. tritici PST-130]|nr:hypothetical protein H4Q26_004081 [Puccinia striiformis f. sp. tritici PST-130]